MNTVKDTVVEPGNMLIVKLRKIFIRIIMTLYIPMLTALFLMSLRIHCKVDVLDGLKARVVEQHQMVLYACMLIAFIGVVFAGIWLIEQVLKRVKNPHKFAIRFCIVCAALVALFGGLFIIASDGIPVNDQIIVFEEAEKLVGFNKDPLSISYVETFPRQKSIILAVALSLKLFGDTWQGFRFFNVIGAFILVMAVVFTVNRCKKNDTLLIVTAILLVLFYPIFVYTAFVYGTLLSAAFASVGFWGTVSFNNTGKKRYLPFALLGFPLGMLMHQSAAIALIAAIMYLLLHVRKTKQFMAIIAVSLCMLVMVPFANGVTSVMYRVVSGQEVNERPISAMAYFYMGLTSDTKEGGPGSIDGSFSQFRGMYPDDPERCKEAEQEAVAQVVKEYVSGERSLTFFGRKIAYQWMDPTMGARKTVEGIYARADNAWFDAYYGSSLRDGIFKLTIVYEMFVYLFALIAGIYAWLKPDSDAVQTLPFIYFIGGFLFQLIWESLSRYCFPYFIWLIPEAAFGVFLVRNFSKFNVVSKTTLNIIYPLVVRRYWRRHGSK